MTNLPDIWVVLTILSSPYQNEATHNYRHNKADARAGLTIKTLGLNLGDLNG
jgi:hypothetical protein